MYKSYQVSHQLWARWHALTEWQQIQWRSSKQFSQAQVKQLLDDIRFLLKNNESITSGQQTVMVKRLNMLYVIKKKKESWMWVIIFRWVSISDYLQGYTLRCISKSNSSQHRQLKSHCNKFMQNQTQFIGIFSLLCTTISKLICVNL